MSLSDPLVVAFLFSAAIAVLILIVKRRLVIRRLRMTVVSDDQLLSHYFDSAHGLVAIRVRSLLEKYVPVGRHNIHPDKPIVDTYLLGDIDGMDVDDFITDLEREFECELNSEGLFETRTLRDIVKLIDVYAA